MRAGTVARSPGWVGRRIPLRLAGLAGLVGLLAALVPGALSGQAGPTEVDLVRLQQAYRAELAACDAAVLARSARQPEYEELLEQARRAQRSGNEEAWRSAMQAFVRVSQELDAHGRRVRERCDAAEEARQAYLDGLDQRRRLREDQLAAAESPQRRQEVQALLNDIYNRYRELERAGEGLEERLVLRPIIDIVPTDTREGVRLKADLLERRIEGADSSLAAMNEEIERLEARLQSQRRREDFEARLGRFEDVRTPVVSRPEEGEEPPAPPADSTAAGGQTLEERVAAMRAARLQLEAYRNRMQERLEEFREYLRTIT